MNGGKKVEFGV